MRENTCQTFSLFTGGNGVRDIPGRLAFFATVPEGERCSLLLFSKDKEKKAKRIPMIRFQNSFVFSVEISKRAAGSFDFYLFEGEKGVFPDPYAEQLTGTGEFGNPPESVYPVIKKENAKLPREFLCPEFSSLIFYKLHIRNFTMHPSSEVKNRGTFEGVKEKIPYLCELGVTAVLLMPVYEFVELFDFKGKSNGLSKNQMEEYTNRYGEEFRKAQQYIEKENSDIRCNCWGYGSKSFYFAPKAAFAADKEHAHDELVSLVDALHEAGIAVFFEFSFQPGVSPELVTDCLRYYTFHYGADGFSLPGDGLPLAFLLADPYLHGVRFLISDACALPDASRSDYNNRRVALYREEGKYAIRKFLRGDDEMISGFLHYFCQDEKNYAQVQFIADHNGFSLNDIFSYERKHNEANGEKNRDGENYNCSMNCGVEGATNNEKINKLREQKKRNALCSVLLARSVPLLFSGDEFSHTKNGNNNTYCQDNEISWLNFKNNREKKALQTFTEKLISFRKQHSVITGGRPRLLTDWKMVGLPEFSVHGAELFHPDFAPYSKAVALLYSGAYSTKDVQEEDCFLCFNMHREDIVFALPEGKKTYAGAKQKESEWKIAIATNRQAKISFCSCLVPAESIVVLTRK